MKIAALPIVAETAPTIGWTADPGFWQGIGLLLLAITALYAWPRTAVLGAVLLTAISAGRSRRTSGLATRSSAMSCSASIWASRFGAGYACVTAGSVHCCRSVERNYSGRLTRLLRRRTHDSHYPLPVV